jgi:hypothetical protein
MVTGLGTRAVVRPIAERTKDETRSFVFVGKLVTVSRKSNADGSLKKTSDRALRDVHELSEHMHVRSAITSRFRGPLHAARLRPGPSLP